MTNNMFLYVLLFPVIILYIKIYNNIERDSIDGYCDYYE